VALVELMMSLQIPFSARGKERQSRVRGGAYIFD